MNNLSVITELATMPDWPVVVVDGANLYQVRSVVQSDGFIVLAMGGGFSRTTESVPGDPVGMPDTVPVAIDSTEEEPVIEEPEASEE